MKLYGKLFLQADILVKTGISIGGDKSSVQIGGIDNSVIKDSNGVPYIPGSSIKGKMRSLLERATGQFSLVVEKGDKKISSKYYGFNVEKMIKEEKIDIKDCDNVHSESCKCGECEVCKIFGTGAKDSTQPTRLYVRDAYLDKSVRKDMECQKGIFANLDLDYTESKWENNIDRLTSKATPRNIERVPAGAIFGLNLVFNVYEESDIERVRVLIQGLSLLEDDYLGANGSRGYGQIEFQNINLKLKTIEDYKSNNEKKNIKAVKKLNDIDVEETEKILKKDLRFN